MAEVTIDIFLGRDGFYSIKPQWEKFAAQCGTHFLHYPGWYEAELSRSVDDKNVFFVVVYDVDGELRAILPMHKVVMDVGPLSLPILELFYFNEMGVSDLVSTISLIPHQAEIMSRLRRHAGFFAFVRWRCILKNGCTAKSCGLLDRARYSHQSKYIAFPEGVEKFWEGPRQNLKKALLKKMRHAEAEGQKLSLACVREMAPLADAFQIFLQVEGCGWKGEQGTSIAKQPDHLAYYQTLLNTYGPHKYIEIDILYLGESAIAAQFGIRLHDQLYLLKIGFSEEHADLRPGYLILFKLMETLANEGEVDKISFVTGNSWSDRWRPDIEPVGIAYSDNGRGYSKIFLRVLQWVIKRREVQSQGMAPVPLSVWESSPV